MLHISNNLPITNYTYVFFLTYILYIHAMYVLVFGDFFTLYTLNPFLFHYTIIIFTEILPLSNNIYISTYVCMPFPCDFVISVKTVLFELF